MVQLRRGRHPDGDGHGNVQTFPHLRSRGHAGALRPSPRQHCPGPQQGKFSQGFSPLLISKTDRLQRGWRTPTTLYWSFALQMDLSHSRNIVIWFLSMEMLFTCYFVESSTFCFSMPNNNRTSCPTAMCPFITLHCSNYFISQLILSVR